MTTYNLNLTKNYCNHWGFWEAIREILQNGEDQAQTNPDNTIGIEYNKSIQTLIISNKESVLERRTLLLGATSKKDDENTIGQFGEGYKIALLVLKKLGKDVLINNFAQNETWTTLLEPDAKYDNEEVLKVKVRKHIFKRLPDHNLAFVIKGVTEEDMKIIEEKYLRLANDVEKFKSTSTDNELLLNEKYKGQIFINGLFVADLSKKANYEFGYNFTPKHLRLDRDRQSVDSFELGYYSKIIVQEYMISLEGNSKKQARVFSMIDSKSSEFSNSNYFTPKKEFSEIMAVKFKEKNDKLTYPVSTQDEADMINLQYPEINTVIVSETEKKLLSSASEFSSIDGFLKGKELTKAKQELTPEIMLKQFFIKHKDSFKYDHKFESEFRELIKESEKWQATVSFDDDLNDNLDDDFNKDESIEAELLEKQEQKSETVEQKIVFDFDEDIPF